MDAPAMGRTDTGHRFCSCAKTIVQARRCRLARFAGGNGPDFTLAFRAERKWLESTSRPVLDRGGSGTRTSERHVRDSTRRGGCLNLVVLLEALESVPEAYASAEQDRDHHDVRVVDEPGGKEVADHRWTPAEAYVLAVRSVAGRLERLRGRSVDEVERRAALHLDRRARVMGEDEDRRVERRVGTPPAPPPPVLLLP